MPENNKNINNGNCVDNHQINESINHSGIRDSNNDGNFSDTDKRNWGNSNILNGGQENNNNSQSSKNEYGRG